MKATNEEMRRQAFLKRFMEGDEGPPSTNLTQPNSSHAFQEQNSTGLTSANLVDFPARQVPRGAADQRILAPAGDQDTSASEIERLSKENDEIKKKYERLAKMAKGAVQRSMHLERQVRRVEISSLMTDSGILKNFTEDLWVDPPEIQVNRDAQEGLRLEIAQTRMPVLKRILKKELEDCKEKEKEIEEKRKRIYDLVMADSGKYFPSMLMNDDKIQLLELIGQGGFASVWKAWDYELADFVAVKILKPHDQGSLHMFMRHFKREVDIMQATDHKNVVKIFRNFSIDENTVAFIMEYCQQGDLNQILKKNGKLSEYDAHAILEQIINGLVSLKSKPDENGQNAEVIIHYDLKPANILFDQQLNPKIADFGLSKVSDTGSSIRQSTPGTGTLGYTAPETFDGENMVSLSADTWSIGIIYYEMLSLDFDLKMKLRESADNANKLDEAFKTKLKNTSDEAKAFIKTCLTKNPQDRPTIKELADDPYLTMPLERRPKTPRSKSRDKSLQK